MKNKFTKLFLPVMLFSSCINPVENNSTTKPNTQNNNANESIAEQLWFSNPQYGLSFETPHKIREEENKLSQDTKQSMNAYYKAMHSYIYNDSTHTESDYAIRYMVIELKESIKEFDTQAGLRGAISNFLNGWKQGGVTQLNLQFSEVKNDYNDIMCDGTFFYMNTQMKVKGYCLFKNHIGYTLMGMGIDNKPVNEKLKRTFESIRIIGAANNGNISSSTTTHNAPTLSNEDKSKNVLKNKNWETLSKQKYSIQYPSNWELDQSGKIGTSFILFAPIANKNEFRSTINLMIQDLGNQKMNLNQYMTLALNDIKANSINFNLIENKRINNENGEHHKIINTGNQGGYNLEYEQYYFIKGNTAYVLTFTSEQSKFEKLKETEENILNSFLLKD